MTEGDEQRRKMRRQSSALREGGIVVAADDVELDSCSKIYFSTLARFTVILTVASLIAAVFVLINIQQYYRAAYDEVGGTLVESITAQVRMEVSKFFVPKFNIRKVFQFAILSHQINTQDTWGTMPGEMLSHAMTQYADIMAPIFYADADFLAAYQALDNRQVLKYAGEIPEQWFTEHRHYVNASYQERLRCFVERETWDNLRDCTMLAPSIKSYDPFAKGWYQTANSTDGDCQGDCLSAFKWEGPGFQTALAEGDTDKPVFNMLFRLNWPAGVVPGADGTAHWSNFKVKFLIDKLKDVVDKVNVGESGDVAIVNAEGQVIAAQTLTVAGIQKEVDGEKEFKKIWELPEFESVTEADLGLTEQRTIADDGERFVVANPIAEVEGWTIVMTFEVNDFLPESSEKVSTAGALSVLGIVLTAVRTFLLLMTWAGQWYFAHHKPKVAPGASPPASAAKEVPVKDVERGIPVVPGDPAGAQVTVVPVGN